MNVLYVSSDTVIERNSVIWRCEMPAAAINRMPGHQAKVVFITDFVSDIDNPDGHWADVIVIQRNLVGNALTLALHWLARGKRVFVDFDDAYDLMPQSVISARFWINRMATVKVGDKTHKDQLQKLDFDPLEHLRWGMKLLTGVTSPSPMILQDRHGWTNLALLVPNYPVASHYLDAAKAKIEDETITIGWAGGGSHVASFLDSGIIPALSRVAAARKNVEIVLMGPVEIFNKITAIRKRHVDWGPYETYPTRLAQLDIGVAPLVGGYDRRRSWLKAVEFSLMGIPWVGTDYQAEPQPYSNWKDHLVRNQAKYWEEALIDLVDNYPAHKERMRVEQEFAKSYDIDGNMESVLRLYAGDDHSLLLTKEQKDETQRLSQDVGVGEPGNHAHNPANAQNPVTTG